MNGKLYKKNHSSSFLKMETKMKAMKYCLKQEKRHISKDWKCVLVSSWSERNPYSLLVGISSVSLYGKHYRDFTKNIRIELS